MTSTTTTFLTFEISSGKDVIRLSVRCPCCSNGTFLCSVKDRPITRVSCAACGEVFTFHSSLLVPLKHLSKNGV